MQTGTRGASLVLAMFGTMWWLSGALALPSAAARVPVLIAGAAGAVTLFTLSARRLVPHGEREAYIRAAGRFRVVNLGQAAGIAVVVAVAVALGEQTWIPGAVATVVGLHFLPLATPFGRPDFRWTGSLLTAVGVTGCVTAWTGAVISATLPLVGLGCAAVLWGSVTWQLASARRPVGDPGFDGP